MTYTEHDVERVAEAMFLAGNRLAGPDDMDYADRAYYGGLARVALDAMEREPLEDVLRAQHVYNIQIEPAGPNFYAEVVSAAHDRRTGTGATIDDAIRAAVAAANEER